MIRVNVTQAHIDNGIPGDIMACALAINDAFGAPGLCEVGLYGAYLCGDPLRYIPLPHEATRFREDFDMRRPVGPISFDFDPEAKP